MVADLPAVKTDAKATAKATTEAATEAEADQWAEWWAEGQPYEAPFQRLDLDDHPGPIHPWMVRAACRTFPSRTGLGFDNMQPRALLRLSDDAIKALCCILMGCC